MSKKSPSKDGKCITCKRPLHIISVQDAFRQKPLRELRKEFIKEDRNFLEEDKVRNQTLAEVLKILDKFENINIQELFKNELDEEDIVNYDVGKRVVIFELKEEIKKIQSPESTSSEDGETAVVSKDTNTQNIQTHRVGRPTGKDVPIVSDESMANKVSTPEPEQVIGKISGANTQNLKGCGKRLSGHNQDGTYIELDCGDLDILCEKCQGKVKE